MSRLCTAGWALLTLAACSGGQPPLPPPQPPDAPPAGAGGAESCESTRYPTADSSPYRLPFPSGPSIRVLRGNCERTHIGPYRFAYDFDLAIGDTVVAARAGEVVRVEERFRDGTRESGLENEVVLRHADGLVSRYVHLTVGGALVELGDTVEAGTPIGLSGDSGHSTGPHLHFDVAECAGHGCRTVPITFRDIEPPAGRLRTGSSYAVTSTEANREER